MKLVPIGSTAARQAAEKGNHKAGIECGRRHGSAAPVIHKAPPSPDTHAEPAASGCGTLFPTIFGQLLAWIASFFFSR